MVLHPRVQADPRTCDNMISRKMNNSEVTNLTKLMTQLLTQTQTSKQSPPGQGKSRSARRRRNRQARGANADTAPMGNLFAPGVITSRQLTQRNTRGNFTNFPIGKMTAAGELFLRAVFAAPDFNSQGGYLGIPDEATHLAVPYRHLYQSALDTTELLHAGDGHTMVIVQLPVPGVAYYTGVFKDSVGFTSTTILHPVLYDDSAELFAGSGDNSDLIQGFRECGRALELVCTSNSLDWSGSIRAFKANLKLGDCALYASQPGTQIAKQLTGLEAINGTSQPSYIGSSNMGVYMVAGRSDAIFKICETFDDIKGMNGNNANAYGVIDGEFTGYGSLEANIILLKDQLHYDVTGGQVLKANSFVVRSWTITEYMPQPNTTLYKTAHQSPAYDPVAMRAYERILKEMPVAVSYFENAKFWDTINKLLGGVLSGLSKVPGPVGGIATGANMVYEGINGLLN